MKLGYSQSIRKGVIPGFSISGFIGVINIVNF